VVSAQHRKLLRLQARDGIRQQSRLRLERVLPGLVQGDRLQQHGVPFHLHDLVFGHPESAGVIFGPGQQAHAILEIDGPSPLSFPQTAMRFRAGSAGIVQVGSS